MVSLELLWILCGFLFLKADGTSRLVVETSYGTLMGYSMATRGGRKISAFTSIPYAVPPLGDLRFKGPIPLSPWAGVYNATEVSPVCVQRNPYTRQKEIIGQEDCLYLNIYSPIIDYKEIAKNLLPVMVFIHGGGWMCLDATTYNFGPEYLLDKDVILVAMNYRLGPLGFLSTQDEACPGNNGLKDQQEALRFVQKVIHNFGGNNKSVTIFGESAGGASVHYHMLSSSSAGLFHKAISQSGTALAPWAEATPGEPMRRVIRLAELLNCPQTLTYDMIECLRSIDSYSIIDTEYKFYVWDYEPMTPFKAVVEPDLPGAFLSKSPRIARPDLKIPWLTGLNRDEGCVKSVWITSNSTRYMQYISGFDFIAPASFYYDNSPYKELITKKLRDKYLTDDDESIKRGILRLYTDSYFAYPLVEAVKMMLDFSMNNIYLYQFDYRGANSFSQIFGDPEGDYGVCHADELMYLFPARFLDKPLTTEDLKISELIVTLWTNFARSGDPTKPIKVPFKWHNTNKEMEYLSIGRKQVMKKNLAERSLFWSSLPLWHNLENKRSNDEL